MSENTLNEEKIKIESHLKYDMKYLDMIDGLTPAIEYVYNHFQEKIEPQIDAKS